MVAEGSKSDHLIGFMRGDSIAVFVPRWPLRLGGNWAGTTVDLPPGEWRNVFTRETVMSGRLRVQSLMRRFPLALLTREAV
jgi:(1->4)-alpha-D-glucan 1-alpha-D-glucosylmutase